MKILEIKKIAKKMGIAPKKMKKTELIRAIQVKEGHTPCYKTKTECGQMDCIWRKDCLSNK